MATEIPDDIQSMVQSAVGDSLRTMGVYSSSGLEFAYLRPDIDKQYDNDEFSRISEKFLQEAFDASRIEDVFNAGDVVYLTYGLENAIVYQFVSSPLTKFFFSVDAKTDPLPKQVGDMIIEYVLETRDASDDIDRVPADELQELFLE